MQKSKLYIFLISILFSIVSCEMNKTNENQVVEKSKQNTLRINFNENILTLNPQGIYRKPEKFVGFLLYEGLYTLNSHGKPTYTLLESHILDSLSNTHLFKIKPRIEFHNGDFMNSSHIYTVFKKILDSPSKTTNDQLELFKKDIIGFEKYTLRKKYKIGNDSLPDGIKIINSSSFSIQFTKSQPKISQLLSTPDFWIYQTNQKEKSIGTGPYKLGYTNEDISYNLIKNKKYHSKIEGQIETINIRFIKNVETEINEFLNGSLDILVLQPNTNNISTTKYEKFNKYKNSLSFIKHVSIYNIRKPELKKLFFHLTPNQKEIKLIEYNKDKKVQMFNQYIISDDSINYYADLLSIHDSLPKIKIPLVVNCKQDPELLKYIENLSRYIDLVKVSTENINPNLPYIVIDESKLELYSISSDSMVLNFLFNKTKTPFKYNRSLLILNTKREVMFTNIMLKGLESNINWSREIKNLYFSKPKVY